MATVKMPESIPCKFDAGGWAPCKELTDNGWCSKHEHLKCVSCGKKAVRSCDAQMGGLACGSPLCETCKHGEEGKHITREVADKMKQAEQEEESAKIASRTSPIRRMSGKLGVPATLFELLKGNWEKEGYKLTKVYYLSLKHGLMGFFPAVFSLDKKRMIFVTDLHLLEKVWQILEPSEAKIGETIAYFNSELGIGYADAKEQYEREEREPFQALTTVEFKSLESKVKPFRWAPGLFGGGISRESFLKQLTEQASILDPTFTKKVV